VDYRGIEVQPELRILAQQRPELAELVGKVIIYLEKSLDNVAVYRDDERAVGELATAAEMASHILGVPTALAKDGGHSGVLASLQLALRSLAATLRGEKLPNQSPLLRAVEVSRG
jgi:hypothetical protein